MRIIFPLALIVSGLFFLLAGIGYWRYEEAFKDPSAVPIPGQITNLPLTGKTTGQLALIELTRLHQKDFPLTSAAVGTYGGEQQVTLWVSEAPMSLLAERMLTSMGDKIAEGKSPFSPAGERKNGNRPVYELEGMGQIHFYFRSGKLLVWMAANPEFAEGALREVLNFYP